jgi:hypothetical protein
MLILITQTIEEQWKKNYKEDGIRQSGIRQSGTNSF